MNRVIELGGYGGGGLFKFDIYLERLESVLKKKPAFQRDIVLNSQLSLYQVTLKKNYNNLFKVKIYLVLGRKKSTKTNCQKIETIIIEDLFIKLLKLRFFKETFFSILTHRVFTV